MKEKILKKCMDIIKKDYPQYDQDKLDDILDANAIAKRFLSKS